MSASLTRHVLLVALLGLALGSTACVHHVHEHPTRVVTQGPPPWAPAHGHRHAHHDVTLVFDSHLGSYVVSGHSDHFFHRDHYYRWRADRWERSVRANGPWRSFRHDRLPPGLRGWHTSRQAHRAQGEARLRRAERERQRQRADERREHQRELDRMQRAEERSRERAREARRQERQAQTRAELSRREQREAEQARRREHERRERQRARTEERREHDGRQAEEQRRSEHPLSRSERRRHEREHTRASHEHAKGQKSGQGSSSRKTKTGDAGSGEEEQIADRRGSKQQGSWSDERYVPSVRERRRP